MATTTTLPRITPRGTPVSTPPPTPLPRSFSAQSHYGPYPPRHLTSTFDYVEFPKRINPLSPPPPKRRINSSWETTAQHHQNDKRRTFMQAREHERYHSAWSRPFYGEPAEKEVYRKHFREVLKQQMLDQDTVKKQTLVDKVRESEAAVQYDRQCQEQDMDKFSKKFCYLKTFRDANKDLMEDRWRSSRFTRHMENRYDREVMRYNPINWSGTLK
ncbi:uncharacterized protein LOC124136076 [Haliotis rufescens]|uniref:uncharacterized protein LOC124136076 n=1 Tax=Haliotis rufescens TaxID=6454 RepID=UPI001EAFC73F|nr:uncharacterized protein LOC124136076 [Haliotis rufescens]